MTKLSIQTRHQAVFQLPTWALLYFDLIVGFFRSHHFNPNCRLRLSMVENCEQSKVFARLQALGQ